MPKKDATKKPSTKKSAAEPTDLLSSEQVEELASSDESPKINPDTYPTRADLSRADHRLLYKLCQGKSVVEFGCGGSTLFLHEITGKLVSYDTDASWVELVRKQNPAIEVIPMGVPMPEEIPPADVYFIDGVEHLRARWVRFVIERRLARTIVMHDSRRAESINELQCLLEWPLTAILDKVEYHAEGSNCLVITLREQPVTYEDWNVAEPANRLPKLNKM